MKKFIVSLLGALGLLAVVLGGTAQAHCIAYFPPPFDNVCASYMPDPPPGWRYCVSPGNPADQSIQLFTGTNYSGYCIERTTVVASQWTPSLSPYDMNDWMGSIKNRRHGAAAGFVLFKDDNYGGCSVGLSPSTDYPNIVGWCGGGGSGWVSSMKASGQF